MMNRKEWVGAEEKDREKLQIKRLRSRKQEFGCRKRKISGRNIDGLTKRALKLFETITQSQTISKQGITKKIVKLILKIWKTTLFLYLNWQKLKLTLTSFILIFKLFILFSVLYSQPKIGNFEVWQKL